MEGVTEVRRIHGAAREPQWTIVLYRIPPFQIFHGCGRDAMFRRQNLVERKVSREDLILGPSRARVSGLGQGCTTTVAIRPNLKDRLSCRH